jgi:hypothetical protein
MVVMVIMGVLGATVYSVFAQSSRIYRRTAPNIEPQASQRRALQRMEQDIREALIINTSPSSATWVEVILPAKDADGFNLIVENPVTKHLGLKQGLTIRYFLGRSAGKDTGHPGRWYAIPDDAGDTVFRVAGEAIIANGTYADAERIVTGLMSRPLVPGPLNNGQFVETNLFTYWPFNDNGTPDDLTDDTPTVNTKLVKITLSSPVQPGADSPLSHLTSWTQFCLRNLQTSQAGS